MMGPCSNGKAGRQTERKCQVTAVKDDKTPS